MSPPRLTFFAGGTLALSSHPLRAQTNCPFSFQCLRFLRDPCELFLYVTMIFYVKVWEPNLELYYNFSVAFVACQKLIRQSSLA